MSAPEFGTSRKKLIHIMRSSPLRSREYEIAKAWLEMKNQRTMTWATWAVGLATFGLITATIAEIITIFKQ